MLPLPLAHRHLLRPPDGPLVVHAGAPLSDGLASAWVADGADGGHQSLVLRNVVAPAETMLRTGDNATGNPLVHSGTEPAPSGAALGRLIPMASSGTGSYGMAWRSAPDLWQPATAGGHAPLTIALLVEDVNPVGRVAYSVSAAQTGGRPYIFMYGAGDMEINISGSVFYLFPPGLTLRGPTARIFTTRAIDDHEVGYSDWRLAPTFSTSTTNAGAATNDADTEAIGARRNGVTTWAPGDPMGFVAAFAWRRGFTRQEMTRWLLDPFCMLSSELPLHLAEGGSAPPAPVARRRPAVWF